MDDNQNNNNKEFQEILNELKQQLVDANSILAILKPLTEESDSYKDIFENIKLEIQKSHSEIRNSKSLNTKYSNDLDKTKLQIEDFIKETNIKKTQLTKLITVTKKLEETAELRLTSIDKLKDDSNNNKKLITEAKNDAENLVEKIRKLKNESDQKIKELRYEKKESDRIQKFLKLKEEETKELFEKINTKYQGLFLTSGSNKKSVISELDENIEKAKKFNQKLDKEIKLNLEKKQAYLDTLKEEITQKKQQVDSLLSSATAGALDEGYLESMYEYSIGKKIEFKKGWGNVFYNIYALFNNIFFRYFKTLFSYIVFIAPLITIVVLFLHSDLSVKFLDILSNSSTKPTALELILFRALVVFPLAWISWFGHKSISQRKRLFEEYNHKSRVVRMYIMFRMNEHSYQLKNSNKLESILIESIANNPAKYLKSEETMIDKILEKLHTKGAYKKLKEKIIKDMADN